MSEPVSDMQNRDAAVKGTRNRENERKREEMHKRKKDKGEKERQKKLVPPSPTCYYWLKLSMCQIGGHLKEGTKSDWGREKEGKTF